MELYSSHIYKFIELFSVHLPKNLDDLPNMLLLLDPLLNISHMYKEKCIKSNVNLQPYQCPILPHDLVDNLLVKCKSKQKKKKKLGATKQVIGIYK